MPSLMPPAKPTSKPPAPPVNHGLGDALARYLKPLARMMDKVAGTDLEHCPECQKRQEWLNRHL